jgi:hydroxyacylglutathione hydrolase
MSKLEYVQFPCLSDNYGVLLHDPDSGATASIDAPDADAVGQALQGRDWRLTHIFVTHKHADHIGGIPALAAAYDIEVTGPEKSAAETGLYDIKVRDGDRFSFAGVEFRVIATPGHTLDHISYYLPSEEAAFVADAIFALGCGRVIEGTHAMMWDSLKRLRELPEETLLYCGHEYTLANGRFAITVEPGNQALRARFAEVEDLRGRDEPTLPTTVAAEKATNPFLRADVPALMKAVGMPNADPAEVFAEIRTRKDKF